MALTLRRRVGAGLLAALISGLGAGLLTAPAIGAATPAGAQDTSEAQDTPEIVATLEIIEPSVSVRREGKEQFKAAKDGQKLRIGDTVKTDETGFAQINYRGNDSFTRLDVNTEFTIVSISDEQGNRKVEGSLDVGRAWNRTTALTESESFETEGAGATAAVEGTAYLVTCVAPNDCIFISVVDGIQLTTKDGEVKFLDPLQQCGADEVDETNSDLCEVPEDVALEVLLADGWIAANLFLDALLGFEGPVVGVITVEDGQVTSFTPITPPPSTPPPPPGPACGAGAAVPGSAFDGSPGIDPPPTTLGSCYMTPFGDDTRPTGNELQTAALVTQVPAPGGGFITFSMPLDHAEVGDNAWATWSHDYQGDVYVIPGVEGATQTQVTIYLPESTYAFYFYAEPNAFEDHIIAATANDGQTSGPVVVNGDSEATYFGFYSTSGDTPITSITITCSDPSGFAIGEFGINRDPSAPAPTTAVAASPSVEAAPPDESNTEPPEGSNSEPAPEPEAPTEPTEPAQ